MSSKKLSKHDFKPYNGRVKEDTLVKDRYYVIEKLGDGCYAKVFLVQDIHSDEVFALKAINKVHFKSNSKLKYMLDKEAKIHRSLKHPNVCKLIDYFDDKNYVFFLLEYVFPGELFEILYKKKGFKEKDAADYAFQTALALKHCADNGVIHRDLKPENLLLNERGEIKLADFGWATYKFGSSVVGSVHYNSPEMLRYKKYDFKADVWALGILIYELLCCEQPFRGSGRNHKDKERNTEKLIKSCRLRETKYTRKLSRPAWNLIKRILVEDPKSRPTYDEILNDDWFKQQLTPEQLARAHSNTSSPKKIILKQKITTSGDNDNASNNSTGNFQKIILKKRIPSPSESPKIKLSKPIRFESQNQDNEESNDETQDLQLKQLDRRQNDEDEDQDEDEDEDEVEDEDEDEDEF